GDSPEEGLNGVNPGIVRKNNLMYELNPDTGAVMWPVPQITLGGAATSHIPFGNFDYNPAAPTMNMLQAADELITGLIQVPSNLAAGTGGFIYAVSNQGRLYRISQSTNSPSATITYLPSSAEDLLGIEFTSVTLGPRDTEGGRYSNMLFATGIDAATGAD